MGAQARSGRAQDQLWVGGSAIAIDAEYVEAGGADGPKGDALVVPERCCGGDATGE